MPLRAVDFESTASANSAKRPCDPASVDSPERRIFARHRLFRAEVRRLSVNWTFHGTQVQGAMLATPERNAVASAEYKSLSAAGASKVQEREPDRQGTDSACRANDHGEQRGLRGSAGCLRKQNGGRHQHWSG